MSLNTHTVSQPYGIVNTQGITFSIFLSMSMEDKEDKQEEKPLVSPLRGQNDYGMNFLDRLRDGQTKIARIASKVLAESDL